MRYIPDAFIPNSDDNRLIEILVEKHDRFDIFWYHWPHDGPNRIKSLIREEDYEPVILYHDADSSFAGLSTRNHWNYQDYVLDDGLDVPPKVLFDGEFHPSLPRTKNNALLFDEKTRTMIASHIAPAVIAPTKIAEKFRTGKGHMTNLKFKRLEDPAEHAMEWIRKYDLKKGYC